MSTSKIIQSSLGKLNKSNIQYLNKFIETSRKNLLLMEEEINEKDRIGCLFFYI